MAFGGAKRLLPGERRCTGRPSRWCVVCTGEGEKEGKRRGVQKEKKRTIRERTGGRDRRVMTKWKESMRVNEKKKNI